MKNLNLASHRINTRSHPDPNPPTIVDNTERILWQNSRPRKPTTDRSIPRTIFVPENLTVLKDPHFDLPHTKNLFRDKSQSDLNQADFETTDLQQSFSREASPSTPPDSQLLHHFRSFHNISAHHQFFGPSVSSTPIHTFTIKNTPF